MSFSADVAALLAKKHGFPSAEVAELAEVHPVAAKLPQVPQLPQASPPENNDPDADAGLSVGQAEGSKK